MKEDIFIVVIYASASLLIKNNPRCHSYSAYSIFCLRAASSLQAQNLRFSSLCVEKLSKKLLAMQGQLQEWNLFFCLKLSTLKLCLGHYVQHKSHVHGLSPTASCILALGINKDFLKKDKPTKRALVLSKV